MRFVYVVQFDHFHQSTKIRLWNCSVEVAHLLMEFLENGKSSDILWNGEIPLLNSAAITEIMMAKIVQIEDFDVNMIITRCSSLWSLHVLPADM